MSSHAPELPPHLRPFVVPHAMVEPVRSGELDLYLPASTPAPAVLLVHGGPVPRDREVRPPQWPAYRGYGALLALAGLVCGMFEHGFVDDEALGTAQKNIRDAVAALRADPRVDPDRFGMWFFSAGGLFMGSVLADPRAWGVAAVAGSYAAPADPEVDDPDLLRATVTAELSDIPLLMVMPENDFEWIVTASTELLERCASAHREVDVIEVPGGHHGFETVDDTDDARDAVRRSIAWWAQVLR
ncbi:alpha/beta hydrolase family protein [Monashia sp. NPDC004114]